MPNPLDRLATAIEEASGLDAVADRLASIAAKVVPAGSIKDLASGTVLGHPLHPLLVSVPIGSWLAAGYLDATGGDDGHGAAQKLIALGALAAAPTALSGASDWTDTEGAERRVGLVHAGLNYSALGLYVGSWLLRRRGQHRAGAAVSFVGAGVLGAAGWLGGHLTYALGVGVDTTAFQQLPEDWTDVAAEADVPLHEPISVNVDGVPILLVRSGGNLRAMSNRCTHRGAPLDEGEIDDGCIICPWHDSRFTLIDGSVKRGPATRPQPMLDVRTVDGRVEVRRGGEVRTLRTNPAGV